MIPILITPPAFEPITLAEAKAWLRMDTSLEDDLINALITSARIAVEQATRLALITQNWRLTADMWPFHALRRCGWSLELPVAPVQGITAINVYDAYDVATLVDPATYRLDLSQIHPRLLFSTLPPLPQRHFQGIVMECVAGFGAAPTDVPEPLRQAVRQLVAHFYVNRGDAADAMPQAARGLIAPFRRMRAGR